MLATIFYIFGLVFVQGAAQHLSEVGADMDSDARSRLEGTVGSVQAAMLTLYMSTTGGDDWTTFYATIQQTGALYGSIFLFFIAFGQIALLNILTGIFVESAMKLAQPDRDTLAFEHSKHELAEADELRHLCEELQSDMPGTMKAVEVARHMRSRESKLRAYLSMLGLRVNDSAHISALLAVSSPAVCNAGGKPSGPAEDIEVNAFVEVCMRLKGFASGVDVQCLALETKALRRTQRQFFHDCTSRLNLLCEYVARTSSAAPGLFPSQLYSRDEAIMLPTCMLSL